MKFRRALVLTLFSLTAACTAGLRLPNLDALTSRKGEPTRARSDEPVDPAEPELSPTGANAAASTRVSTSTPPASSRPADRNTLFDFNDKLAILDASARHGGPLHAPSLAQAEELLAKLEGTTEYPRLHGRLEALKDYQRRYELNHAVFALLQKSKEGQRVQPQEVAQLKKNVEALPESDSTRPKLLRQLDEVEARSLWTLKNPGLALAKRYGAQFVKSGSAKGSSLSLSVPAKADHCYVVLTRWVSPARANRGLQEKWSASAGRSALQQMTFSSGDPGPKMGACALSTGQLKLEAKILGGPREALEYVVLDWPRANVDPAVLGGMAVVVGDRLNTSGFKSLWLRPVPGSLVYWNAEPHLLVNVDERAGFVDLMDIAGHVHTRIQVNQLRHQVDRTAFSAQWSEPPILPAAYAQSPASLRLSACVDKVLGRTEAVRDRLSAQSSFSESAWMRDQANQKHAQIAARDEKRLEAECGAIKAPLMRESKRVYSSLLDAFENKPAVDPVNRPALLMAASSGN